MSMKRSVLLLALIFHGNVVAFSTCFLSANRHHNLASIKKRNVSLLSSTNTAQSEVATSTLVNKSSFDNFDYLSHWYPVIWARDLELDTPTKVSIFDVDYVIAKINGNTGKGKDVHDPEVIAMVDVCPHKTAALSEGRITEGGNFQCAYHGWKFNSKTGACIEIPQVERLPTGTDCDGTAIPAMISQGIVWLFPGGGLEKALLHPPPEIPELKKEGYRMLLQTVRDFPIDWTILIENIVSDLLTKKTMMK
jgi:phenylpropionate dioxygenase-like ring-hydroxylating dioxygenase large terminal subunit